MELKMTDVQEYLTLNPGAVLRVSGNDNAGYVAGVYRRGEHEARYIATGAHLDDVVLECIVATAQAPNLPAFMFRDLNAHDTATFEQWAQEHFAPGQPVDPCWHPAVRTTWQRLQAQHDGAAT